MKSFKKFLDKPTPSVNSIAKRHGVSPEYISAQLAAGIEHEKEHTSHKDVAKEIALDHIGEKPDYYQKLKKIEEAERSSERAFKLYDYITRRHSDPDVDKKSILLGYNRSVIKQDNHFHRRIEKELRRKNNLFHGTDEIYNHIKNHGKIESVPLHKVISDQNVVSREGLQNKDRGDTRNEPAIPYFIHHKESDIYALWDGNHRVAISKLRGKKDISGKVVHV